MANNVMTLVEMAQIGSLLSLFPGRALRAEPAVLSAPASHRPARMRNAAEGCGAWGKSVTRNQTLLFHGLLRGAVKIASALLARLKDWSAQVGFCYTLAVFLND